MRPADDTSISFEAWVSARQHALLRSAYLLTGDVHRAEDLVQDALLKVALRWDRLRAGNPDSYVRTIVYRTHISWWRASREHAGANVEQHIPPRDEDARERPIVVRAALARLTTRQRAVLVLRYFDDLTEKQTAVVLGISIGSVKKHSAVARHRLREIAPELGEFADRRDETT